MAGVLVTGGSGTLGSHVVAALRRRGHDVRVLSRRPGVGTHTGDLATGAGVDEAVGGVQWVVHAASETRRFGRHDVDQTRQLLAASAHVEHFLYISIVGIDQVPYRYYREKLRCEELVAASAVPSTILRATQFHELLAYGLGALARLPVAPVPARFKVQPVAAVEVATHMADLVEGPALGRAPDMGGPEVLVIDAVVAAWSARRDRPRRFVRMPVPGKVGRAFREGRNTCPDRRTGDQSWVQFLTAAPSTGAPRG